MNLTNLSLALTASLAALAPCSAHADTAGDRVLLLTGAAGCPSGQTGFRRLHQSPDGPQTLDSTEFQVPAGKYLEITNIEYTFPYWTAFASSYVQSVDLFVRQRVGTQVTNAFAVTYSNAPVFDAGANGFSDFGQYTSPGAETHVATFPAGPLVSSQARLCLSAASTFFSTGRYKIRGRLIAADATIQPPGGGGIGALP